MLRFTIAFLVLLCVGTVLSNHLSQKAQLGSFEGTYSSDFGLGMYICQDDEDVHGYSDEHFIFHGKADALNVLTGTFHQAGEGNCVSGTFELDLTSWGVEGFYICKNGKVVSFSGVKNSPFRPTNAQCATLWHDDDIDLQGRYVDSDLQPLDICFRNPDDDGGDDDDETVQASRKYVNHDGVVIEQYITGFWYDEGKVFSGTWYENFNAGGVLMYLRDNGNIDYSYWTGLYRKEGSTYIDRNQAYNSALHKTGTIHGPGSSTLSNECTKFEVEQTFVLKNLRAIEDDDDNNYYYFVNTEYIEFSDIEYVNLPNTSSANSLIASFSCLLFTVFAIMF